MRSRLRLARGGQGLPYPVCVRRLRDGTDQPLEGLENGAIDVVFNRPDAVVRLTLLALAGTAVP